MQYILLFTDRFCNKRFTQELRNDILLNNTFL